MISAFQRQIIDTYNFYEEKYLFNLPLVYRLFGDVNIDILRESFEFICSRHESLRTIFTKCDSGGYTRKLQNSPCAAFSVIDLSARSDLELEAELQQILESEAVHNFDLEAGPLIRLTVTRCGVFDHVLAFNLHHIVGDGASYSIVLRELSEVYSARVRGEKIDTLPPAPQYAEFLGWQLEQLESGRWADSSEFWREHLADLQIAPGLRQPGRPCSQGVRGAIKVFHIPAEENARIKKFLRSRGASMFVWLLMCLRSQVAHTSGEGDLVIGCPVANRPLRQHKAVVGPVMNVLPLKRPVDLDATVAMELLAEEKLVKAAFRHAKLPTATIRDELLRGGSFKGVDLFNICLIYHEAPHRMLSFGEDVQVTQIPEGVGAAKNELAIMAEEMPDGSLSFEVEYRSSLYSDEWISEFAGNFIALISEGVAKYQLPLRDCLSGSTGNRALAFNLLNETQMAFPNRTIAELIDAVASLCPERMALADSVEEVTYGELRTRSDDFASNLVSQFGGSHRGGCVALAMSPSVGAAIAIMGILKAGCTYVPIDLQTPPNRIEHILSTVQPKLIVSTPENVNTTAFEPVSRLSIEWLLYEQGAFLWSPGCREIASPVEKANDSAYVIFTSGSTGAPKGVSVTNQNLVNFALGMQSVMRINASDTLLSTTRISFDIFGLELFLPLIAGARVYFAPRSIASDPKALIPFMETIGATVLQGTPPFWQQLRDEEWCNRSLRLLLCGGEKLDDGLGAYLEVNAAAMSGRAFDLYGPTETTIWSSYAQVEPGGARRHRPLANTMFELVTERGSPAALNEPGELWIAGAGVASGYYSQPDLTSERFIFAQVGDGPSQRYYRTGDIARLSHDGRLEFLGRNDQQIKHMGFRIELGDVQAAILRHPAVVQCATLYRPINPKDPSARGIVAFLRTSGPLEERQLLSFLQDSIPNYMFPEHVVQLSEFPLTSHGKTDYRALASLDLNRAEAHADSANSPREPLEYLLLLIIRESLGRQWIQASDDFFDVGGNSLIAMRAIATVRELTNLEISFSDFVIQRTVRNISQGLSSTRSDYQSAQSIAARIISIAQKG